ncbi:MAG: DJ-1/PfpI family protein [Chthoniobacteraceae bacterium]
MPTKGLPADIPHDHHLHIGAIIFPNIDQIDFTGPFGVLCRVPDSTFHIIARDLHPVRDEHGLLLMPQTTFRDAPPLDVLVVPGGPGQVDVMEDAETIDFIRDRAAAAKYVFSVCTGALLCGAAGLLKGRVWTTHWASHHLLKEFGAIPIDERVVVDGKFVSTAGVTAGLDGALRLAALLRGEEAAQQIQLAIEYQPEPPFDSGTPDRAPHTVLFKARAASRHLIEAREEQIKRTISVA